MSEETKFALPKKNLIFVAIGFVIIMIGFICMLGGESEGSFNPEIFSFRRITFGPMIALLGFLFEIFAILWLPKKEEKE